MLLCEHLRPPQALLGFVVATLDPMLRPVPVKRFNAPAHRAVGFSLRPGAGSPLRHCGSLSTAQEGLVVIHAQAELNVADNRLVMVDPYTEFDVANDRLVMFYARSWLDVVGDV